MLFLGSTRANGPFVHGQDLDYGGLWEIKKRGNGFTFRSVSANKKYIGGASSPQSTSAVTWKCFSRYSYWKNRDIPYQRRNDEAGTLHTFCVPYDATLEQTDVYEFLGVDNTEQPTCAWFKAVTNRQTLAGEAYLLRSTTDEDIQATMTASSSVSHPNTTSAFTGVFQPTPLSEGNYTMGNNEWRCIGSEEEIQLPAYHAMLDLNLANVATSGDLCLPLHQIPTALHTLTTSPDAHPYYTLQGIPVEKPTSRGIYIHGGRKFFVQ